MRVGARMWELVAEVRAGATMWYVEENRRVKTQVRVGAMMWSVCMYAGAVFVPFTGCLYSVR